MKKSQYIVLMNGQPALWPEGKGRGNTLELDRHTATAFNSRSVAERRIQWSREWDKKEGIGAFVWTYQIVRLVKEVDE